MKPIQIFQPRFKKFWLTVSIFNLILSLFPLAVSWGTGLFFLAVSFFGPAICALPIKLLSASTGLKKNSDPFISAYVVFWLIFAGFFYAILLEWKV